MNENECLPRSVYDPSDKEYKMEPVSPRATMPLVDALLLGLQTPGAHHKQWALWRIAEILNVTRYLQDVEDKGIAP